MIRRYDSIAAVARDAKERAVLHSPSGRGAWFSGETGLESVSLALRGDARLVPDAEKLLSQIDAAIEVSHRELIADRVGAYPCVAEYLQGAPDCMRRRAPIENEAAPVAMYVVLAASASIDAATLLCRGVAILALAMALSRSRPIELNIVHIGDSNTRGETESVMVAPINTAPLDLASAAYVLTSAGFLRHVCFGLQMADRGFTGGWPAEWRTNKPAYLAGLLRRLGADPARDIIIGSADHGDELLADPVAWVNRQIARFRDDAEGIAA